MQRVATLLILLLTVSVFSIVSAAENPFGDVPAKHWAYDAVAKLAQAGLIDGYDDGVRGERVKTRYEMAQLVARAMWNGQKANTENKQLISKLSIEFADELKSLGVLVSKQENEKDTVQNPLKIDGHFLYRYEYVKNPRALDTSVPNYNSGVANTKTNERVHLWFNVSKQFDGDTYFLSSLCAESISGTTASNSPEVWQAFVAKKIGDKSELAVGRFIPTIGLGTLDGTAYNDGARLILDGKDTKVSFYATTVGEYYPPEIGPSPAKLNFLAGDVKLNLDKDLLMSLAYRTNHNSLELYKSTAIGLEYKKVPNLVFSGEYAKNTASYAKLANSGQDPKAYYIKMKYKGANPMIKGSTGFHIQYKKADSGFDLQPLAGPTTWNAPYNWTYRAHGGAANDLKGFEYSFEVTVAKSTIFSVQYDDLKRVSNDENQNFLTAQIFYLF